MNTLRLEYIRTLSGSTREFRFACPAGMQLDYKPGQFYRFVFRDERGEFERSYSLCNYGELYGNHMDLVISKVEGGRATRLLFNAEPGLTATVTGPFGRLTLPKPLPGRLVLVATSVGLAPFMPMLKALETQGVSNVILVLGVRDKSEFIYGEILTDYAARHPGFELRLCLSREAATEPFERGGYVTAQLPLLALDPATDHCLLCGNPRMIDDAWGYLSGLGFKARQVVREKYVFAKEKTKSLSGPTEAQKKLIAEKLKQYHKKD